MDARCSARYRRRSRQATGGVHHGVHAVIIAAASAPSSGRSAGSAHRPQQTATCHSQETMPRFTPGPLRCGLQTKLRSKIKRRQSRHLPAPRSGLFHAENGRPLSAATHTRRHRTRLTTNPARGCRNRTGSSNGFTIPPPPRHSQFPEPGWDATYWSSPGCRIGVTCGGRRRAV